MTHPMCGANLRRGTKVVAFGDAILSGITVFVALLVLYTLFMSVKDPEVSAYAIGGVIIFVVLMVINVYLAFRLYRSAHERNLQRLKQYRETALIILTLSSILALLIRHAANNAGPIALYPLLWFYILCVISSVYRVYMYLVVKAFLEEFELV
ncbi:hypothetical protein Ocin01_11201 [Orchesella cincta]|uniref:Uncharacterized protein n=1 Tax=Orchesella cincta TaxID=48709 RepID=A0A1D2MQT9_ORCCI|nr:hypothetical protein Ocin01_11201 [Orchesella cincta]